MRALLAGLLMIALAVAAGAEAWVPGFLAARVADGLQASLGSATVQVQLTGFPALRMLWGRVDRLTVTVAGLEVDGLALESLRLEAAGVELDVAALLRGQGWQPGDGDEVTVEAVIREEALAELVRARLPAELDVQVALAAGGMELRGRTSVLGLPVDVAVRGRMAPEAGGTRIVFVPEEIAVGGQVLAEWIAAGLRQAYTAAVDLGAAPVPVVVEAVVHEPGRVIVTGRPAFSG